ncbi:MarR family transcriptional regulator [Actinosynnema sp. NPDC047251]|uniref:MarR family transcriptional regulator n=1 Tax=Saccharothrix espanaensis TaxID=103731 RepID=UPI0002F40F01
MRFDDAPPSSMTHSQMRLLGTLEEIESARQHRLAQALSVSDPAIPRALRPLEADGLIQVAVAPEHARRRLGWPPITLHRSFLFTFREARHTHATWMAEDGITVVARRPGSVRR